VEPRLAAAQAGQRTVLCVDAAHVVLAPCWEIVWCVQRLFVRAPSGRQQLHVLAALHAIRHELCTVENRTYITAETVCELWRLWAEAHQGILITVFLDNARSQQCALVQAVAQECGIELGVLPAYSPHLNLSERLGRFVNKPCLDSQYYQDSTAFQHAVLTCIHQAPTTHQEALHALLTLRFQTFTDVPIIGEPQTASTGSRQKFYQRLRRV
jgi:DDE superfamily endonuclease